jgi:large subunit ribosomal protein L28
VGEPWAPPRRWYTPRPHVEGLRTLREEAVDREQSVALDGRHQAALNPNLQRVRLVLDGKPTRDYVCTRCLKAGKVTKAV